MEVTRGYIFVLAARTAKLAYSILQLVRWGWQNQVATYVFPLLCLVPCKNSFLLEEP